jgi:hypothetical protein
VSYEYTTNGISAEPPKSQLEAQRLLLSCDMVYVLLSWVSISVVLCLALVRAAARRQVEPKPSIYPATSQTKVMATSSKMNENHQAAVPALS